MFYTTFVLLFSGSVLSESEKSKTGRGLKPIPIQSEFLIGGYACVICDKQICSDRDVIVNRVRVRTVLFLKTSPGNPDYNRIGQKWNFQLSCLL